jgi:hypothetical protein
VLVAVVEDNNNSERSTTLDQSIYSMQYIRNR